MVHPDALSAADGGAPAGGEPPVGEPTGEYVARG
ncbi:hypothetical protein FrEUN1fDRAFT_4520 [Parafrankia sp. EUN1f]|nr:hypothetical protein FrEUN1fDRAFT_4520 [Parafrankia sp. EUN1f]